MPRQLTAKQNKFIDGILSGLSQSEAYRQAYECKRMTPQTIAEEACKLAAHPKVTPILDERRKKLENAAIWTREQALKTLAEDVERARKANTEGYSAATSGAIARLIEQANKMCGYNEPDKVEISGVTIKVELEDE